MGFMDKAREAAQQASAAAQKGKAQGQAKIDEIQTARAADALLRKVGAAYYAEQRKGGSHEAVVAALAAMDAHIAANGPPGGASGSAQERAQSPWNPGDSTGWQPGTPSKPFSDPTAGPTAPQAGHTERDGFPGK